MSGDLLGTTGKALRMEAMHIKLVGNVPDGGIEYRSHVQGIGWETTWKVDGELTLGLKV